MLIFGNKDGDFIHTVSDSIAMDFDRSVMMNCQTIW